MSSRQHPESMWRPWPLKLPARHASITVPAQIQWRYRISTETPRYESRPSPSADINSRPPYPDRNFRSSTAMSKAPPSPSFRPPLNARKANLHLSLANLSISPPSGLPPTTLSITPPREEISPVEPLDGEGAAPNTAAKNHAENHDRKKRGCSPGLLNVEPVKISPAPEDKARRRNSQSCVDNDIYAFDDEGWARVANSEGIEEMLKLGEGVSGSVMKCRLRKSGQVFAIKVRPPFSNICALLYGD